MTDPVEIAYISFGSVIAGGIIGKGVDLLIARFNGRNSGSAKEAQAKADQIAAENNLRTIQRIDADNQKLQKQLDDEKEAHKREIETMRADFQGQIDKLTAEIKSIKEVDDAVRNENKVLKAQKELLINSHIVHRIPLPDLGLEPKI